MIHEDEKRQVAALEKIAEMTAAIGSGQTEELQRLSEEVRKAAEEIVKSLKESQGGIEKESDGVTKRVIMIGDKNIYIDCKHKRVSILVKGNSYEGY